MKKTIGVAIILSVMVFGLSGCYIYFDVPSATRVSQKDAKSVADDMPEIVPYLIEPGEVFERGGYIEFEDVQILYDGEDFAIQNDRDDIIRITSCIVGVKKDGTYESIQWPAFGGVDETQYGKDLEENGWAIKHNTNMVRPGETLVASMEIFDFNKFSKDYPAPDIDGDGYYDVVFRMSPQTSEDSVVVSTSDPESEVYRLKVK